MLGEFCKICWPFGVGPVRVCIGQFLGWVWGRFRSMGKGCFTTGLLLPAPPYHLPAPP